MFRPKEPCTKGTTVSMVGQKFKARIMTNAVNICCWV